MTQPNQLDLNADAGQKAAEQAATYESVFGPRRLTFDDDSYIEVPPHPDLRMFDDDKLEEYDAYLFEIDSCDRTPDIVIPAYEAKNKEGVGTGAIVPAETIRGRLLTPYRKNGELLKPPFEVRTVQIALGPEDYAQLRAGKIHGRQASAADVRQLWTEQSEAIQERNKSRSEAAGRASSVAAVAASDSQ